MVVKAVIFDVGGVLVTAPQTVIRDYEKELGLPKYTLAVAFIEGAPNNAFCRLERGEIALTEFAGQFKKECMKVAQARGLVLPAHFSPIELFSRFRTKMKIVPEMIGAVKELKKNGYKTAVITNNWMDDTHDSSYPLLKLGDYFDTVLESYRLGMRKPDEPIYTLACTRLGVRPEEVIFLDDLGVNLKGARALGMKTILVRDPSSALKQLEKMIQENSKTVLSEKQKSRL